MGIEGAHFQTNPFSDILQRHMKFRVSVFSWTKPCLNDEMVLKLWNSRWADPSTQLGSKSKNLRVDPNPNHPTSGHFTFLMLGCVLGILMYFGGITELRNQHVTCFIGLSPAQLMVITTIV